MILILTQCFPSRFGGVESLISNLALGLSETEKITVFADKYNKYDDRIFDNRYKDKISVKRIGGFKFYRRYKKVNEIKKFARLNQIKLVIADSWKSLEIGIKFLNSKKIPTVCLAHGNELLFSNFLKENRIKNTLNKVSKIVANSNFTKNLVKNIVDSEIPINVVMPGAADIRGLKEKIIPNIFGNPIVFTLARLEKRKGHFFIINAIKKIIKDFPDLQYIIAGDGPEKKSLKNLVLKNNLEKHVIFIGNVNENEKKYLFLKSDLMIMPTLDERKNNSIEGFGIAYLEAACFSIPSVASNVGGTPEAVLNNQTGIIINNISELYKEVNNLLGNRVYLKELGDNAKKRAVNEFNWSKVSKKYLISK